MATEEWDGFGDAPEDEENPTTEPGAELEVSTAGKRMPDTLTSRWINAQLPRETWEWIRETKPKCQINGYLIEAMARHAKKGASKRAIMARAGYSYATWDVWQRKAEAGEQPYHLWYQCMLHAMASIEEELLDSVRLQASGDWRAAKWMLEQLNRDEFGPTPKSQTVNIAGDVNNKTETTTSVNHMDDAKALEVAKLLQNFGVIPPPEAIDGEVVEETDE